MIRSTVLAVVLSLALCGAAVVGTPIPVTISQSSSTLSVELCIAGSCDSDSSHVAGQSWIKLSPLASPTSITVYDFDFALTESIDIYISWGFLGNFTGTGTGLTLSYPTPFVPLPPAAVTSGAFFYGNVPGDMTGTVSYVATGLACTALQGAGYACNDSIDLAGIGTQTGEMDGTVTVSPQRVVTLFFQPDFSGPLDPDYPSLGTISVWGTVTGQVTVPLRGDANLDGAVDGDDVPAFASILLAPDSRTWQERFVVDMNDDDAFDVSDAGAFVDCLLNGNCGL